jgi:TonB family protein
MLESYLIAVAAKSSVLLGAGILALWCLRRLDAKVRHLVCLAALASSAAVPMLALWSPQWSLFISVAAGTDAGGNGTAVGTGLGSWPIRIAAIWALGALVLTARAIGGCVVLARARRWSLHFQRAGGAEVRIAKVSSPFSCGVLRPLILLPSSALDWDESRLRVVLLHEMAHVHRRDCLAKYVAQGARALLWWNPLAWMIASRLNHEQELACDDAVLSAGVRAETYAKVLIGVAREFKSPLTFGCAMADSTALRDRLTRLFEWRQDGARSKRRTAVAIPLLLLLMTTVSIAEKTYKVGPGIVPPKVLEKGEPQYTEAARNSKIEGPVVLTLVIGTDQRAHDIKVVKSLDAGLDSNAVASIKTWRFQPGNKNGKPVPVRATVEVNFRLR